MAVTISRNSASAHQKSGGDTKTGPPTLEMDAGTTT